MKAPTKITNDYTIYYLAIWYIFYYQITIILSPFFILSPPPPFPGTACPYEESRHEVTQCESHHKSPHTIEGKSNSWEI